MSLIHKNGEKGNGPLSQTECYLNCWTLTKIIVYKLLDFDLPTCGKIPADPPISAVPVRISSFVQATFLYFLSCNGSDFLVLWCKPLSLLMEEGLGGQIWRTGRPTASAIACRMRGFLRRPLITELTAGTVIFNLLAIEVWVTSRSFIRMKISLEVISFFPLING